MSFGLTNAPSTFQRLMEFISRGLQWKICLVNIDDISIFSRNFEDHLKHLATVFDRLRDAGLKHKPSKCHFGCFRCHTVPYLGFIATPCMIKIFRGGRGGDTFKPPPPYEQLFPLPIRCFWMFLQRSLNDPPPPHFKHPSLLPPPHPPPLPP